MAKALPGRPLGVYVHFPYCSRLCPYCDFAVVVRPQIDHVGYLESVLAELSDRAHDFEGGLLQSIYFGGGTPGLWDVQCIGKVIEAIQSRFQSVDNLEVTVEANPEHVDAVWSRELVQAGVNRLSLGVQSFDDGILKYLGRKHDGEGALQAIKGAYAGGLLNISVDLIFGSEGQNRQGFAQEVRTAMALPGVQHVSLYQLTIEPQTVFGRLFEKGQLNAPDPDLGAAFFEDAERILSEGAFEHYEVSNYGKVGFHSRHNSLYWTGAEYLGLGLGAHSLRFAPNGQVLRRANGRNLKAYLKDPIQGESEVEKLSDRIHLGERLFTGLRTQWGVDLQQLQGVLDVDIDAVAGPTIAKLIDEGFLTQEASIIKATAKGLRLGDQVAERLVDL